MSISTITGKTVKYICETLLYDHDLPELYETRTEVTAARDGQSTLLAKINVLKAAIAALASGSGVTCSSNDTTTGTLSTKIIPGNKTYAHTDDYTVLAADLTAVRFTENNDGADETLTLSGQRHTNTGATADIEFDLPAGTEGDIFNAAVTEAYYIQMNANGTEQFRVGTAQSEEGGYVRSNSVGSTISFEFLNGEWVMTQFTGLWTYDE